MNILITAIVGVAMFVGGLFTQTPKPVKYDGFNPDSRILLGATSFPTSLDALTNPATTDSVATVSHSGQHSNANDAIEALEAKVGTGASTASNNTIFVGDGSGSSSFSTSATSSNFFVSGHLTSASSTLWRFSGINSTTTNATSTNFYVSTLASTTAFRSNTGIIGNLTVTTCTGCSTGVSSIEKASSTAANLPSVISTSTPLTIGHKVLIMGWCSVTYSNDERDVALYVKPASSATSSALAVGTAGDSDSSAVANIHITGIYVVAATESHEIYLGTNDAVKQQTACDSHTEKGITYVVLN